MATLPDTGTEEHGYRRWRLIRRSSTNPTELVYYLRYGPTTPLTKKLIRVAGTRWEVKECFQTANK